MPELPEVETVRRSLEPLVVGAEITSLWTSGKPLRMNKPVDVRGLKRVAIGGTVSAVRRRAKYLLVDSDKGTTLIHLGMTGRVFVSAKQEPRPAHTHVVWGLADGREMRFADARRFGVVLPVPKSEQEMTELAELGLEPLGAEFTPQALHGLAKKTKRPLKTFLLDQTAVAGLGNIYVAEALFHARLHPHRASSKLTAAQAELLHAAIVEVLTKSIDNRGTSFRDYVDASGELGFNQLSLAVYGRTGEPCPRCGKAVRAAVTQGRATFYCPSCQSR